MPTANTPKPFLTIGMATYMDSEGVWLTVNALRHYHDLKDVEILVVDNKPDSASGKETKTIIDLVDDCYARYVPFPEGNGPAQVKNKVFEEAQGEFVLLIDSHVLLRRDSVARLKEFYRHRPNTGDLYQGPMMTHRSLSYAVATHQSLQWGSGMFGQWAAAWRPMHAARLVEVRNVDGKASVHDILTGEQVDNAFNGILYAGHENVLQQAGWSLAIAEQQPFEIPSQGTGLLSCRKSAWLGFNPQFTEFGGEEHYIQEKFRRAGYHTYCIPWLVWHHRYYRDNARPHYANRLETKFRNHVIGHIENELPLDNLKQHFIDIGLAKTTVEAIANDVDAVSLEAPAPASEQPAIPTTIAMTTRDDIYIARVAQSDFAGFASTIEQLVRECETVTEISDNADSAVMLLAGAPKLLTSYQSGTNDTLDALSKALSTEPSYQHPITWTCHRVPITRRIPIEPTDMLFLNYPESIQRLASDLEENESRVNKFIAIANTTAHAEGYRAVMREFTKKNRKWFVMYFSIKGKGVTVLANDPSRKPKYEIYPGKRETGAGLELSKMLSLIGFKKTEGCGCGGFAAMMNQMGVEWCRDHVEDIVNKLKEEYNKRKLWLPFSKTVARWLVRKAIQRAEKNPA